MSGRQRTFADMCGPETARSARSSALVNDPTDIRRGLRGSVATVLNLGHSPYLPDGIRAWTLIAPSQAVPIRNAAVSAHAGLAA